MKKNVFSISCSSILIYKNTYTTELCGKPEKIKHGGKQNFTKDNCKQYLHKSTFGTEYWNTTVLLYNKEIKEQKRTFLLARIANIPASVHTLRISAPKKIYLIVHLWKIPSRLSKRVCWNVLQLWKTKKTIFLATIPSLTMKQSRRHKSQN